MRYGHPLGIDAAAREKTLDREKESFVPMTEEKTVSVNVQSEDGRYSMNQIAALFKMAPSTVSRQMNGVPAGAMDKRNRPLFDLPTAARVLYGGMKITDDDRHGGMTPQDRKAMVEYESKMIDLQAKNREYVLLEDMRMFLAERFKKMDLLLSTLPDEVERQVGIEPDQLVVIDNVIDTIRTQLVYDGE